jgi:hypothetical protein
MSNREWLEAARKISFYHREMFRQIHAMPIHKKMNMACDVNAEPYMLVALSDDCSELVRANVAANPSAPDYVLRISFVDTIVVQRGLALNTSSPPDLIRMLAEIDDVTVAEGIAGNEGVQSDVLRKLRDKWSCEAIDICIASNPIAPQDLLGKLFEISDSYSVLVMLAGNPGAPIEVIRKLYRHKDPGISSRVAANPSVPRDIIEEIISSPLIEDKSNFGINPNATPEMLISVLSCEVKHIYPIVMVAQNRNITIEVIHEMVSRFSDYGQIISSKLIRHIFRNPAVTDDMVAGLIEYAVRPSDLSEIVYNPSVSEEIKNMIRLITGTVE